MHDDCELVEQLAPGWALGALDRDESRALRAHLASCGRNHPQLREALALAAAVGGSMPDEDLPSAALRGRLLERVRGTSTGTASQPAPGRPAWRAVAVAAGALALAASVALAVQVGENGALRDRVGQLEQRLTMADADLDRARAWIDRAVARGATAYFMDGEGEGRQASFMLVVEPDAAGAMLLMSGLPAVTGEEAYELWVERDGDVIGVGTFRPDDRGMAALAIDASLTGIRQATITLAADGRSAGPSEGEVIMQGELSL